MYFLTATHHMRSGVEYSIMVSWQLSKSMILEYFKLQMFGLGMLSLYSIWYHLFIFI
jgi:hypothetical protein